MTRFEEVDEWLVERVAATMESGGKILYTSI